ncbi:MAG: hypothetical protein K0B16_17285 [Burkholderiaceae bacterium]|nr:hypothetical protein [Burkholderiaceae bacterium]
MVHPGRIHGYVERKFRDRKLGENVTIIIPVILCPIARAVKTQYTKRLLPEFLIPHSVIRLDYLLEAADLPKAERSEAAVCDLIGCLDPRTVRHQMQRLAMAINAVSLDLTGRRAATPELGELPQISPGTPPEERLAILFDSQIRAGQRAGSAPVAPSVRQLLQAAMGTQGTTKPSNRASSHIHPP